MKKLALLFAGLALFATTTACNDDEETAPEVPLVGTWQPLTEVRTEVDTNGDGVSDLVTYSTCQRQARWVFKENSSGTRTTFEESGVSPVVCAQTSNRTFSYAYDKGAKTIELKYQGTVVSDKGKITRLDADAMNLMIEDKTDPTVFKTVTYSFKRIPQ
ncbi:lipocalin family protein [Chryseobacterium caseinilyticum]|uniref:Lipocalin family protein n=1 Tax=Chryseobacterium caseinilyticum TaxID=2771428 RepID=A0ABR8ZG47_9FLAO|nr:lipocalin family protein [Chryseobacterium caseinilyticum]MBD8083773.1 lipocalin family protein [Chryseobacterium caseinilyticum]